MAMKTHLIRSIEEHINKNASEREKWFVTDAEVIFKNAEVVNLLM